MSRIGRLQELMLAPWAHPVLPKAHYSAQTVTLFWIILKVASTPFHYLCKKDHIAFHPLLKHLGSLPKNMFIVKVKIYYQQK